MTLTWPLDNNNQCRKTPYLLELRSKIQISVPTGRPTLPLAPTSFDRRLAEDLEENRMSLPPLSRITHSPQISLISFFFFLSFSLFVSSPLPPPDFFDFLQVRGNFFSLYYSSCHVSPFPWSMCDTCSRWHSPHHMALMPCVLLP